MTEATHLPRSLAQRFTSLSAPRHCIGCGNTLPPMTPANQPCANCQADFAVYNPATMMTAGQAARVALLVPVITAMVLAGLLTLALVPHLIMVWLDLGPLGLLLYFPALAVGGRIGTWLNANGLHHADQRVQMPAWLLRKPRQR